MSDWRIINPETAQRIDEILRQDRAHTKKCHTHGVRCSCGVTRTYEEFTKAPRVNPKDHIDVDYVDPSIDGLALLNALELTLDRLEEWVGSEAGPQDEEVFLIAKTAIETAYKTTKPQEAR